MGVPLEYIQAGGEEIPWLDPYSMVSWLASTNRLELLTGGIDILEFWKRFAKTQPDCPVLTQGLNLARVIPFLSHGDEGRTKKKRGILLWSLRGVAGSGTRYFKERCPEEQAIQMPLNLDESLRSRFLHAAVPNRLYHDNEACWYDLSAEIGRSYRKLQFEGFEYNGQRWFAACVGLTGDAPFLSKAACLRRNFLRFARKANPKSNKDPIGICFCCLAGTKNVDFEELGLRPKWLETMATAPLPWDRDPPFLQALGDLRPGFLQYETLMFTAVFPLSLFSWTKPIEPETLYTLKTAVPSSHNVAFRTCGIISMADWRSTSSQARSQS